MEAGSLLGRGKPRAELTLWPWGGWAPVAIEGLQSPELQNTREFLHLYAHHQKPLTELILWYFCQHSWFLLLDLQQISKQQNPVSTNAAIFITCFNSISTAQFSAMTVFDTNLCALWPETLNHQGPYGLHIHPLLITALPAHLHLDLQASQLAWRLFNTHAFGTISSASKIHKKW